MRDQDTASSRTAWFTSALQPRLAYKVPPPAPVACFTWVVCPEGGCLLSSWSIYTDGSMLDGPHVEVRRTGWAFVALDDDGKVQALARGVPPRWISTIVGAEAWAVLQALLQAPAVGSLRIDCKAAVGLLQSGPGRAVTANRVTASVWASIFAALDQAPPEGVAGMPAHTAAADIGHKRLGNGDLLTANDRRANDIADYHAKQAVEEHRAPEAIRKALVNQEHEVTSMAWWIAIPPF